VQDAVERAIGTMWCRYHEPLSLLDLADSAILSRFYFSRVFRSITGTSPGRFLAAIRLYRAKNLLLESESSVTDISYRVGYNSTGTFTSRFTRSVGMSPTRYRQYAQNGESAPWNEARQSYHKPGSCTVQGMLYLPPAPTPLRVYVGAFDSSIPDGAPSSCAIVDSAGQFQLEAVPDGTWHLLAAAVATTDVDPRPWVRRPVFLGSAGPISAKARSALEVDIHLHETTALDPPVLLALPELDAMRPHLLEPVS
jgi:AraC-like DNA-binding protein